MASAQTTALPDVKNSPYAHSETPHQVFDGTAKLMTPYEPTAKLRLAIGINPPHLAEEEVFLKTLQDRKSPNFHKYLKPEEWNARFAPSAQDEQAVVDWANSQGLTITARYPNRLMVNVEGTVDAIQRAFQLKINHYQINGETEFSNDRDPIIPGQLSRIISAVDGLNSIQRMKPARPGAKVMRGPDYIAGPLRQDGPAPVHRDATQKPPKPDPKTGKLEKTVKGGQGVGLITNGFDDPTDIYNSNAYDYQALYNQGHCCNPAHIATGSPVETSIGLATDGDVADSDIQGFQSTYPYLAYYYHHVWVGGNPGCCSDEATLDLEWSLSTANSFGSYLDTAQVWVYAAAGGFGSFGTVYQQMLNDNVVRVVNISYGLAEYDGVSDGVMNNWHAIFDQMIGQGWTIMAASGDGGATTGCSDHLRTIYPGSDPDVVAVGGTQLTLNGDGTFNQEVAWTGDTWSGACSVNDGGSGGGCSSKWGVPGYQTAPYCGSRSVPDIALNASPHSAQNYYYGGALQGVAGTSIASPMVSGFMAQANAYLLAIGLGGAPVGEVNYKIYWLAQNPGSSYEAHYPFYDTTSGCNSNDDTIFWGLGSYCAGVGYDAVTGWGTFNALQLSWAINTYDLGDFGAPVITFSGPAVSPNSNTWFNTDQTVSWTIVDTGSGGLTPTGVAGFSQGWDTVFSDPTSEATPGAGNSFYSGPQFPNATSGSMQLSAAGQGCHYATVDAWDNSGITSGNQFFYWICYDTVPPVTTATLSGTLSGGVYVSAVTIKLSATDATSGVSSTFYSLDGAAYKAYSAPIVAGNPGTHTIFYYSTDVAGNVESLNFQSFVIDSPTATTLASTLNPSVYGQAVTFTAKVTASFGGTPTGTITFKDGAAALGTVALSGGTASLTTNALHAGAHSITAAYSGTATDLASASAALTQTVNKATSATALISSLNPSIYWQSVTLTATVTASTGGAVSGTVTFKDGATILGSSAVNAANQASLSTITLGGGSHSLTAVYGGSADDTGSTSPALTEVVNAAVSTTALVSSLNPSVFGTAVTLTATITPAHGGPVTGTVTFKDGVTTLGTEAVNAANQATYTTSTLTPGNHTLTAVYGGSANDLGSTSAAHTETVKDSSKTTLVSSVNPSTYGKAVTFTATVTLTHGGAATGTVTFKNGAVTLGTVAVNPATNKAAYSTSTLAAGSHSLTAVYSGSANDAASTSAVLAEVVNKATSTTALVSSLNPSTHGTTVTFTATITPQDGGTATGTVTFKDGATTLGTVSVASNKAALATSTLAVETHPIFAIYNGDANVQTSDSNAVNQVVK